MDTTSTDMEVDEVIDNVLSTSVTGSVSVSLHPLVILNISEHWTRLTAQVGHSVPTLGALIGKQKDRTLEIMNSFELSYTILDDSSLVIDRDYYNSKEEQFKQVFCDLDFLGWYITGTGSDKPSLRDIEVHKQITNIAESPIFLKMDPHGGHTDLPVKVYESIIDIMNGETKTLFVELSYTLSTEDAERIGVDHVARMSSNDAQENSLVAETLTVQFNAIKMLHSRVKMLLDYLKEAKNSEKPINNEILREYISLCHRLPVMESGEFYRDLYTHCNDVALIAYLGVITKCSNEVNDYCNKFNALYDRQVVGRKVKPLFL
ncbi:COP9 signalosome subunit 6,JAB1/MPN/MOV34 metalloenzyme domain,Rpn11/EIF3F, C-terminal [Cinara cedri]|uniref:COP9 signalosome complex subunit 6 n=2 Tax=Cinara cedri TaxID=506608 RepID=A0A5E4MYS0_9HEMI|nr:COP9 signalosome subunit 6,JAB1/MPN/MOV34 metalloenzyme domain,Rpn11/EIF3F, C-terminal [Cinara cedri]